MFKQITLSQQQVQRKLQHATCLLMAALIVSSCASTDAYTFRCTEVGADASVGPYTKLAGTAFNLDVVALYNGAPLIRNILDINLGLLALQLTNNGIALVVLGIPLLGSASKPTGVLDFVETTSMSTCESGAAAITDLPLQVYPLSYDTLYTMPSNAQVRQTVSGINISNAHKTLMCRVTVVYSGNTYRKCGAVTFATRPARLDVTSTAANADASGTSTTALPVIKAGSGTSSTLFSLTATGKNASGTTLTNYNGSAAITSSSLAVHAGGIRVGNLTPLAFAAASNGASTGNFSYSEVGYFKISSGGVKDNTYTAVDQASNRCISGSSSNTLVGGKYGCDIANTADTNYFGRFIPFTFRQTAGTTTPGCASGSTSFTYFGGEFTTRFTMEAANDSSSADPNVYKTFNYHSGFAKFANNSIGQNYANYNFSLSPSVSGAVLTQGSTLPSFSTPWSSGAAVANVSHKIARPSSAVAPTSVLINAAPTDLEATATTSSAVSLAQILRQGRLLVNNAYGAETMPLPVTMLAQYWTGTAWVTNVDDSCSSLPANAVYMNFPSATRNNLAACETSLSSVSGFTNGRARYLLSTPGHGNQGWVTMTVNLSGQTGKTACIGGASVTATNANLNQFYDSSASNPNPAANASFGQFRSGTIYAREN